MWRKLTEDDLEATMSHEEIVAYATLEGLGDPVRYLLDDAAAFARTYIRSNGNVKMDPDETTVPASCVSPAMDYVAVKILKRINIEPNEIRKQARTDAIAFFNQIARGEITPESYGASEAEATGGACAVVVRNARGRVDAGRLEGL